MRTRRIIRGKRTNRTVSKRNKKSAKKKVYRRKTVKGGVRLEPISIQPSMYVNEKMQTAKDTRQLFKNPKYQTYIPKKTRGLEKGIKAMYSQQSKEKQYAEAKANEELQQYKELQLFKNSYEGLLTNYITEIPVTQVLNIVFEKYPMKRFSSYFGKNVQSRQQFNIQDLAKNLNAELCSLDENSETGSCSTGFTAAQWANSKYCKTNYIAKSGLRYWDTGDKLCEYIPYAMKQLEKDCNCNTRTLLFKMENGKFYFIWVWSETYTNLFRILSETKDTSLNEVNQSDCLVKIPEYNWNLQRNLEILTLRVILWVGRVEQQ